MYENLNDNPMEGITSGINEGFKISSTSLTEYGWKWNFKKGGFETGFFGNWPYLAEGKEDKWSGINQAWAIKLINVFKQFIPEEQVSERVKKASAKINKEVSPEESTTSEGILKGAQILYDALIDLASPLFAETEFNLLLCYQMGLDKEGEEKWYLNIPGDSGKKGNNWQDEMGNWHGGYPFAVGKNPPMNPNLVYVKPGQAESNGQHTNESFPSEEPVTQDEGSDPSVEPNGEEVAW